MLYLRPLLVPMNEPLPQPAIPDRAFFKAAEVCDLAKVQPYVLRSWEAEFKDLGVARTGAGGRIYRRVDVERVLRIKHLLLVEGLTLAGVRRKLDEEAEPPLEELVLVPAAYAPAPAPAHMPDVARARIGHVKAGLRSLLALLEAPLAPATASGTATAAFDFGLAPAASASAVKPSKRAATRAVGKTTSPESVRSS